MPETLFYSLIISLKIKPRCLILLWLISLYVNRIASDLQVFDVSSAEFDDLEISPGPLQCRQFVQSWPGTTVSAWRTFPFSALTLYQEVVWSVLANLPTQLRNAVSLPFFLKWQIGTYTSGSKTNITCYWMLNFPSEDLLSVQKHFALVLNINRIIAFLELSAFEVQITKCFNSGQVIVSLWLIANLRQKCIFLLQAEHFSQFALD